MSRQLPESVAIEVASLPELLPETAFQKAADAVVIDTLRFTTTASQALHVGAESVRVERSVKSAFEQASQLVPRPLLCGERHCNRIDGFDLGNSPHEYTHDTVQHKQLLFTTTNGTKAVHSCLSARRIQLAALVNCSAVAMTLLNSSQPAIWLVCAGTDGEIATEDLLAAGAVIARLLANPRMQLANDQAHIAHQLWNATTTDPPGVANCFANAAGGINLIKNNYQWDLEFAAQVDHITAVPCAIPKPGQPPIFRL